MSELLVVETKAAKWNKVREKLLAEFSEHDAQGQALEKELRLRCNDERLIVRFIENVPDDQPMALGIKPFRWHIIRKGRSENEIDHYLPIVGPEFQYRPPEMKIVEDMQKADLMKPGALEKLFKDRERQVRLKEADAELRKEQLADEVALAYRANKRLTDEQVIKNLKKARQK